MTLGRYLDTLSRVTDNAMCDIKIWHATNLFFLKN